jgi:hypothetical protein
VRRDNDGHETIPGDCPSLFALQDHCFCADSIAEELFLGSIQIVGGRLSMK